MENKKRVKPDFVKEYERKAAKRHRDWLKALSPEALAEYKQNKIYDKQRREDEKRYKQQQKEDKILLKRELVLLKFMLKHDVEYHHHSRIDSMKKEIQKQINYLNDRQTHLEYHPYVWNYQGQGKNHIPLSYLGCLFRGVDSFNSIYEIPLDGTYKFIIYDSGERGLGSFNRITATKVEVEVKVPKVSPGSIIPITAY